MHVQVVAYVTRRDARELLVFEHRDYPNAGTQAPAGTVEADERLEEAIIREVGEESGLQRAGAQSEFVHLL